MQKINFIALVAGISTLALIGVSWFVPWWHLAVGSPMLASVNVSPVNLNLALLDNSITIPLIYALNIASALSLGSGGIIMLIYSVKPDKSYSKKLLGFGYKKPLYAVILFIIGLFSTSYLVQQFSGFGFPMLGSGTLSLPQGMAPDGTSISVAVSAGFGWPFYFAIMVAALCISSRVYHRKMTLDMALSNPPADSVKSV
jgi:hypothetical protein